MAYMGGGMYMFEHGIKHVTISATDEFSAKEQFQERFGYWPYEVEND